MTRTTSQHHSLLRSIYKVLKEDADQQQAIAADRVYAQLLDAEANKVMAQVMVIVQSSASATDKLQELVDLLGMSDEDEEEENSTPVVVNQNVK